MKKLIELCLSDSYEQLEQYIQENKMDLSKKACGGNRQTIFEVLALNEKSSECLSSLMLLKRLGATPLPIATSNEFSEDLEQLTALPKGTIIYPTKRLAYSTAIKKLTESKNVPPERVIALMIMSDQKIVPEQLREFATQEHVDELLHLLNLKKNLWQQRLTTFLMSSKEKKSDEKKESPVYSKFWKSPIYDKNVLKIIKGFLTLDNKTTCNNHFCLPRFAAVFKKDLADSKKIKIGISYDNEATIKNFFQALTSNNYECSEEEIWYARNRKNINGINFEICFHGDYEIEEDIMRRWLFFSRASQDVNIMLFFGKSLNAREYVMYTPNVEYAKLLRICYTGDFSTISQLVQLKTIPVIDILGDKFRSRFELDILPRMCEITLFEQLLLELHSAYISPENLPITTEYHSESPEPPRRSNSKCSLM